MRLLVPQLRAIVALGGYAWTQTLKLLPHAGVNIGKLKVPFGHGVELALTDGLTLVGSYHPSQQNTFTGKLTEEMFDRIWARARALVDAEG